MNCKVAITIIIILLVLSVTQTQAMSIKNLGVMGETYPIVESDILAELKKQANQKQPTRKEILEKIKTYQPSNMQRLPGAKTNRTFLVDMTYTFEKDIVDANGNIIYPKGYTFNPLDYFSFPGGMVVIDGDDPDQIKWFKKSPYFENHQARLLLSGGYAHNLVEQFKRPVFYLTNVIAKRLQLAAVPSVIVQQGKKLQVREVYIPLAPRRKSDE